MTLPFDAILHSGISGEEYHNYYPVEWAKINREIASELGLNDEAVIFHRSGYRGSQKYANLFGPMTKRRPGMNMMVLNLRS